MTKSQDAFRPLIHFTPPQNWMNDPNGLVYVDGEYHLFYQHNPYATDWGHMSWGHAVSIDLVHWEHLPIAIWEEPSAGYTIFSGSAVIDATNSAGFGVNAMVTVYTADYAESDQIQDIHIAYSNDKGRTFKQYEHNPVIATGESKFGDPKVFWHPQDQKWIMVNICHRPQGHVELYSSTNLKEWGYMSSFSADEAAPGIWECPDLFPLAVDGDPENIKWVMKINCTRFDKGPAATRYFVGDFDGKSFSNAQLVGQGLTSDDGAIYAEVTYNQDLFGRRVLMGWLRQGAHVDRPWTGAMAIPRELSLKTIDGILALCQQPCAEATSLRQEGINIPDNTVEYCFDVEVDLRERAIEVQMGVRIKNPQHVGFRLILDTGQVAMMGYDAEAQKLYFSFEDKIITAQFSPLQGPDGNEKILLRLYLDQAHIELFGDNTSALTCALPFGTIYSGLAMCAEGGAIDVYYLDAWKLQ